VRKYVAAHLRIFYFIPQVSALKYANDSAFFAACLGVPVSDFQQVRDQECLDMFGVPVCLLLFRG
jgi:hypothetical protein